MQSFFHIKKNIFYLYTVLKIKPLYTLFRWTTQQIKSQGSLSIHSNGHRDLKITAGTGNSHFDSRGGVVGGTIDLNDLNLFGIFIFCTLIIIQMSCILTFKYMLIYQYIHVYPFGYCIQYFTEGVPYKQYHNVHLYMFIDACKHL